MGKENKPLWCQETTEVITQWAEGGAPPRIIMQTVGEVNKATLMGGWQHYNGADPEHTIVETDSRAVQLLLVRPVLYASDRGDVDGLPIIPSPKRPDHLPLGELFRWVLLTLSLSLSHTHTHCR